MIERLNILLLDDNKHNLDLLESLISNALFSKSLVKTGAAAIRVATRIKFALAILDINLPDMNGFEVAKEIRKLQPDCEIIFCSAFSDRETRERSFEAGGLDYIEKPFETVITHRRIQNQIDKIILRESLKKEKIRLEKMVSSMVDAVVTTDLTDQIVSFNSAAEKIFKISHTKAIGTKFSQFVPPSLRERHAAALQNFKDGKSVGMIGKGKPTQLTALTSTGDQINVELILSSWQEQNSTFVTAIIRDISEQKLIESSLAELSSALNDTHAMVGRYSKTHSNYLWMTEQFGSLIKHDPIREEIDKIISTNLDAFNRLGSTSQLDEITSIGTDGSHSSYLVQVLPAKNPDENIIFVTETTLLSALQRKTDTLLSTVRTDDLTGCLSRRAFFDDFENGKRTRDYVVALLDIDYFKSINDYYSHDIGDLYLKSFAEHLSSILSSNDVLARLGGEEFALAFPSKSRNLNWSHLEMIRQAVSDFKFTTGGRSISRSVSVGGAQLLQEGDITKALAIADEGLQLAKSSGRNRVVLFDETSNTNSFKRVGRPSHEAIKTAFRFGEIFFDYQKVIDASIENEIVGYEALIRMRDQNHKIIPPNYFVDEYYHLSNNSAENMSRASLFRHHLDLIKIVDHKWISYNVRGSDLVGKNLAELIELCSPSSCGLQVCLELSEEEISDRIDLPALQVVLEKLKTHGFRVYLDDFGKEKSNFHRLVSLPFDVIKLDRSLVQGLGVTDKAEKLVSFLGGLTKEFDMLLVAEGVETEVQANILARNGLYLHQGFLYGRPMQIQNEPLSMRTI